MRAELMRWPERHPFGLAVVVMLIMVIPGFARAQTAIDQAEQAAQDAQAQSDRNTVIVDCLTAWVADETDSLQDRDSINRTARAASKDLWASIRGITAVPPTNGREVLLRSIDRYLKVLRRVDRNALINPYPEIDACLQGKGTAATPTYEAGVTFEPMAYVKPPYDKYCFGHKVTIRGTFGADNIRGTDGPDVIFAYSGDDLIVAGKGNDLICGRYGGDTVLAGLGYDKADCGPGDDVALQAESTRSCG